MATVGDILTAPEAGWNRIDDRNSNITYVGTWTQDAISGEYNSTATYIPEGLATDVVKTCYVRFNFTGTKIRCIHSKYPQHTKNLIYKIDGFQVGTYNFYNSSLVRQIVGLDILGLEDKEHWLEISSGDGIRFDFDALDIGSDAEIKPYNPPADSSGKLLRVTLIDSSDHDYQLSSDEIAAFVKWYNGHASTDTHAYGLGKKIGTQVSTEYVAFEKIISFEVI